MARPNSVDGRQARTSDQRVNATRDVVGIATSLPISGGDGVSRRHQMTVGARARKRVQQRTTASETMVGNRANSVCGGTADPDFPGPAAIGRDCRRLHTHEVIGSSPIAPTTHFPLSRLATVAHVHQREKAITEVVTRILIAYILNRCLSGTRGRPRPTRPDTALRSMRPCPFSRLPTHWMAEIWSTPRWSLGPPPWTICRRTGAHGGLHIQEEGRCRSDPHHQRAAGEPPRTCGVREQRLTSRIFRNRHRSSSRACAV